MLLPSLNSEAAHQREKCTLVLRSQSLVSYACNDPLQRSTQKLSNQRFKLQHHWRCCKISPLVSTTNNYIQCTQIMLSSCTGSSGGIITESKVDTTSSSSTSLDTQFDVLFSSYSQSMFSGLLDGDLLDEELNGKCFFEGRDFVL